MNTLFYFLKLPSIIQFSQLSQVKSKIRPKNLKLKKKNRVGNCIFICNLGKEIVSLTCFTPPEVLHSVLLFLTRILSDLTYMCFIIIYSQIIIVDTVKHNKFVKNKS